MRTESELVLDLIREIGVQRLGNWDGCACSSFSLRNVDVEISCGKGRIRGVRISSSSIDYDDTELLRPIAEEVRTQVESADQRGPCSVIIQRCK